jgi:Na+-translocating ferredoxin:NAD+ oxidoreductase RnfD subunit
MFRVLVPLLLVLLTGTAWADAWVVPQGRETQAIGLLEDVGFEKPLAGGLTWDSIGIARDHVDFALHRVGLPDAPPLATIAMRPVEQARPGDRTGKTIALHVQVLDPAGQAQVEPAIRSILAHENPVFFQRLGPPPDQTLTRVLQVAFGLLLAWALALAIWLTCKREWHRVAFRFQPTHLLPAMLQCSIFAFWATRVPAVQEQLPRIALQLAFAYSLDFLLGMTKKQRWDATFGPVPVVLSANLFVWVPPGALHLALLVVTVALASKWLIGRQGRHIFNPSALGVAVLGLLSLLWPNLGRFEDISHLLDQPGMMPLLLGLALVAQVRVPIVLVTLPAVLVLLGLKAVGAYHVVYPFWPAVFLAVTLLATDPATIPHTGPGRLLYGIATGLGIWAVSAGLTWLGRSDFYGKVLPIPVVNLLVPQFDRVGAKLCGKLLAPRWNLAHVAVWLVLASGFLWL